MAETAVCRYRSYRFTATDKEAARVYIDTRAGDARQLRREMLALPYVAVRIEPSGEVLVGETRCASVDCAIAYILARWW